MLDVGMARYGVGVHDALNSSKVSISLLLLDHILLLSPLHISPPLRPGAAMQQGLQ